MRVLVTGAGRSGTCWTGEIVKQSGMFHFTKYIEDRAFFLHPKLKEGYATKLATENDGFTSASIIEKMNEYPDLHIVFCTRHPADLAMAKLMRAVPYAQNPNGYSQVGTKIGTHSVVMNILHASLIYKGILSTFPDRLYRVRLEELISNHETVANMLSLWLGGEPNEGMYHAHTHTQNQHHKRTYDGKIDKDQVGLWKRWDTIYDGYFADKKRVVQYIFNQTNHIAIAQGYPIARFTRGKEG